MAFSKLVFYPIKATTNNALPTYLAGVKLYSGSKTNNISLELSKNTTTVERKADDQVEKRTKVIDYTATINVYGIDKAGLEKICGYVKDADGSFTIQPNEERKRFGVFFESVDDNDGKTVQHYLYSTEVSDVQESYATDDKTSLPTTTITLNGFLVRVSGKDTLGANVYEGTADTPNSDFEDTIPTTKFYKATIDTSLT